MSTAERSEIPLSPDSKSRRRAIGLIAGSLFAVSLANLHLGDSSDNQSKQLTAQLRHSVYTSPSSTPTPEEQIRQQDLGKLNTQRKLGYLTSLVSFVGGLGCLFFLHRSPESRFSEESSESMPTPSSSRTLTMRQALGVTKVHTIGEMAVHPDTIYRGQIDTLTMANLPE